MKSVVYVGSLFFPVLFASCGDEAPLPDCDREEFYREKACDYVQAAQAIGVSNAKIMARHTFPNALVPVVMVGEAVREAFDPNTCSRLR